MTYPIRFEKQKPGMLFGLNTKYFDSLPYTDPALPLLRPKLLLPTPNSGRENVLIDLDGKYCLNSAFSPLAGFFKEKRLAVVHGVGNTFFTRSHLDAAQYWASGTPGNKNTSMGWLDRA